MSNNLAHTIRLYPTKKQDIFFRKACGCARVAYNYALQKYQEILTSKGKPNILEIKKQFNKDKKNLFPWMSETNKDSNQQPFSNLQTAFKNFFKKQCGFPVFKKKGKRDSFYISNDKFKVDKKRFWVPKLGWVKGAEELRFIGKINSATIKRKANYWFVVVSVQTDRCFTTCENQEVVGVDLGTKTLATLSDGSVRENVHPLKKKLSKLARLQRSLSRKVKGSSNRFKQRMRIAKLYYRIACFRKDVLDKLTTLICRRFRYVCIEDLNIEGMLKNHKLALAISDVGFGEFKRQLEYKSKLYGNQIILADRWFPSSKMCSCCGWKDENLKLSDRTFVCKHCGLVIDRDLNAAINLKNYGLKFLGKVFIPEVKPMDRKALANRSSIAVDETILDEVGISRCSERIT